LLLIEEVTKFLAKSKQFLLLKRHPSLLLIEEVSQLLAKSKHFLLLRRHPSLLLIEPRLEEEGTAYSSPGTWSPPL
jgi:preprotein translocase subunit Sss1